VTALQSSISDRKHKDARVTCLVISLKIYAVSSALYANARLWLLSLVADNLQYNSTLHTYRDTFIVFKMPNQFHLITTWDFYGKRSMVSSERHDVARVCSSSTSNFLRISPSILLPLFLSFLLLIQQNIYLCLKNHIDPQLSCPRTPLKPSANPLSSKT
jgi:hypothetical protein